MQITAQLDTVSDMIRLRKQQLEELDLLVKSQFIEMFGDPVSNPMGWPVTPLSDFSDYYIGLTYKPSDEAESGIIVLRSGNIQNGKLDLTDLVRVDKVIPHKLIVQQNDILMCSRNGSERLVGKVALLDSLQEEMTFGAFMTIIRSHHYRYLMAFFEQDAFRAQITSAKTTTINQITKAMLDSISIPLPPLALQNRFAAFVESTDKSKFSINQVVADLATLKQSMMQKYFGPPAQDLA